MYDFKIWDQSNDGNTMAIRVADTAVLDSLKTSCTGHDMAGKWSSLAAYLNAASTATTEPDPYTRVVDVLWLPNGLGVSPWSICHERTFRVLNTGPVKKGGGFSSQGYVILDPAWNGLLRPHKHKPILARYFSGPWKDLIVVLP